MSIVKQTLLFVGNVKVNKHEEVSKGECPLPSTLYSHGCQIGFTCSNEREWLSHGMNRHGLDEY